MARTVHVIGPRVSVVIPALNEAKNLPHVFARLDPAIFEIILVDGASVDGTAETALSLRPDVRVIRQTRQGKGNALACGFAAARGDVIVTLDADGSADPKEIPAFVAALAAGADFAKGTRFTAGGGSEDITSFRRLGNALLGWLANVLFGSVYTDLCYGYNAFWRDRLGTLGLHSDPDDTGTGRRWGDGFEIETVMNVRAAACGLTVTEVPSFERRRVYGASNLHAVRDGLRVLRTLLTERRAARRAHPRPAVEWQSPTLAPTAPPQVSVVIAAFADERWDDLVDAVASVTRQTMPAVETIVVIDHNPRLLARATAELPDTWVVSSAADRGASGARNTGAALASGEIIAFLDDDAVASPTWLEQLVRPLQDTRVVGTGGALHPRWQACRPRWFPPEFDWVVGCSYHGMPTNATQVRNVWSVNMALRRSAFDEIGGFRTGFGKVGARSRPEDTDLCLRASELSPHATWVYEPTAVVEHKVPATRGSLRYFLTRSYQEGRGKAELAALVGTGRSTSVERGYVGRVLPRGLAKTLVEAVRGDITALGRAAAIVAGLTAAGIGLAFATASLLSHKAGGRPAPSLESNVEAVTSEMAGR